jgi:hypothetical protein
LLIAQPEGIAVPSFAPLEVRNFRVYVTGASIALSMATTYACGFVSSGKINTGVRQLRTKSRVTVQTKSALVR